MASRIMSFNNCIFTNSDGTLDSKGNFILGRYSGASLINMVSINLDLTNIIFSGF